MHILVVDDKESILTVLRTMLENAGHSVETALNGLDAFEKAQYTDFDLFVIDHLMPVMNGLHLSKNLKQHSKTFDKPIFFITTQDIDIVKKLEESVLFSAILSKPIDESKLVSFINHLDVEAPLCHLSQFHR